MSNATQAGRARSIIRREYGDSDNFMTPDVEGYELLGDLPDGHSVAVERSRGTGFNGEPIYGASFVLETPEGDTRRMTDLSDVRFSREAREALIDTVRDRVAEAKHVSGLFWNS